MKQIEKLSKKLEISIEKPICKMCFKDLNTDTLSKILNKDISICHKCYKSLDYKPSMNLETKIHLFTLAPYKEPLSTLLINFKENKDYELGSLFLDYYSLYLRILFRSYYIVPIPSSKEKERERGFSHLHKIFSSLRLPFLDILQKNYDFSQKKENKKDRENSKEKFSLKSMIDLSNKKILLVDDVITTGSSIRECLKLILSLHPKKIAVLVVMNSSPLNKYVPMLKELSK